MAPGRFPCRAAEVPGQARGDGNRAIRHPAEGCERARGGELISAALLGRCTKGKLKVQPPAWLTADLVKAVTLSSHVNLWAVFSCWFLLEADGREDT